MFGLARDIYLVENALSICSYYEQYWRIIIFFTNRIYSATQALSEQVAYPQNAA